MYTLPLVDPESATGRAADLLAVVQRRLGVTPNMTAAGNDARGGVAADVDAVRYAGATDEEIAETIGHVALTVLTSYFNKAVDVDVDFPVVTV
jgi:alkylhydroperoxidase/carboxymuconolactone decarboxylase family protein YurZ